MSLIYTDVIMNGIPDQMAASIIKFLNKKYTNIFLKVLYISYLPQKYFDILITYTWDIVFFHSCPFNKNESFCDVILELRYDEH